MLLCNYFDQGVTETIGVKQDIEESLKDLYLTKIDGKPMDEDLKNLENKLSANAVSVLRANIEWSHGYLGLICEDPVNGTFSNGGVLFIIIHHFQQILGEYPTTVNEMNIVVSEYQMAEHKAKQKEFKTYFSVVNALHLKIKTAVDPKWLEAFKSMTLGFTHKL